MKYVVIFSLTFLFASLAFAEKPKVGVLYPMSGEFADQGLHSVQGIRLAIEELKATDDFEFVFEDAGSDSGAKLASAVKKLIEQNKVDAILGPGMIPQALVVAPITERAGVPLVTNALCSPDLLKFKNLVCGYPSTKDQLADLKKIAEKFQVKNLAFISDHSHYGTEVGEILEDFSKKGIFTLSSKTELDNSADGERMIATKVLRSKPDAIFSATQSTAVSLNLFKRLSEQGYKGTRIGFLDVDASMLKGFGNTLNGVLLPGYVTSNYAAEFVSGYKAKYQTEPDMYAAICHDILIDLVQVLKAGATRSDLILKLTQASPTGTALTGFHFNKDRTINLPLEVLKIADGSLGSEGF